MSEHPIHIGILTVEVFMPQAASLKEKRSILRSAVRRLRNKFNVSVAEIDFQDIWQRGVLGIVIVGTDKPFLNSVLDKIVDLLESFHGLALADYAIEFI